MMALAQARMLFQHRSPIVFILVFCSAILIPFAQTQDSGRSCVQATVVVDNTNPQPSIIREGSWVLVDDSQRAVQSVGGSFLFFVPSAELPSTATSVSYRPFFPETVYANVYVSYKPTFTRANNVRVTVVHANGLSNFTIDQTQTPNVNNINDRYHYIGFFEFNNMENDQKVTINGTAAEIGKKVVADAVKFEVLCPLSTLQSDIPDALAAEGMKLFMTDVRWVCPGDNRGYRVRFTCSYTCVFYAPSYEGCSLSSAWIWMSCEFGYCTRNVWSWKTPLPTWVYMEIKLPRLTCVLSFGMPLYDCMLEGEGSSRQDSNGSDVITASFVGGAVLLAVIVQWVTFEQFHPEYMDACLS